MKILFTFLSTLILINFHCFSQINIQWESRYDNVNLADYSKGVVIDAAGNSYVTGTSYNGSDFDIVTVKYDPDGIELWTNTFAGAYGGWDDATGLVIDSNNDIIVGGFTQTGGVDYDFLAFKIDGQTGNQTWAYTHPGTNNFDQCRALTIDSDDRIILVGSLEISASAQQFLTLSLNSNGTVNWTNAYPGGTPSTRHVANAVTVDINNNVYVAGESTISGNLDYFIIKYASGGGQLWTESYDGNNSIDVAKAIAVDDAGYVYVTGTSYIDIQVEEEIGTIKIDPAGNTMWSNLYGGSALDFDSPNDISIDDLGNIYIAGKVKNIGNGEDFVVLRYRPNGDLHWDFTYQSSTNGYDEAIKVFTNEDFEVYASGYSNLSASSDDYMTFRLDTLGNEVWQTRFDGPSSGSDQMSDFKVDISGNLFVTGSSVGSGTNRDYSTIKYCQLNTIASADKDTICIGESVQLNATGGFNFEWELVSGDPITATNFSCTSCDNPIATPDITSTYTISSESSSGCVDVDTITIIVNPLPGPVISTDGPTEFCEGGMVTLTADPADDYDWNTNETTQAIVADTSGIYALTVTDSMGCQNSTNIEVIVFENPIVNGGNDRFRCPGVEITLNATGADSLVWFTLPAYNDTITNGEAFVPPISGSYEVVGINNTGCQSSDTITITIFPAPFQVELEQGMSGNLIANTTDENSLEWFLDGDALNHTGFTFFYDEEPFCNGVYGIIYTDENGCKSEDTLEITDACPEEEDTASVNLYEIESFNLYPNPTTNVSKITFESLKDRLITVYDPQGKIISETKIKALSFDIDLTNAVRGTYFIKVVSNERVGHAKLIRN